MRLRPMTSALFLATAGLLAAVPARSADLLEAFELASKSDPQLAAAESQASAQKEAVVQSRAALLPQVNASASLTDTDGDNSGVRSSPDPDNPGNVIFGPSSGSSDTRNRDYGLNVQQSVYDRSAYTRLGASKALAEQATADYEAAQDALIVRVAEAYFNVLTGIETLASARAEEEAVKRQLDQAETRLEVGLAPITDVHEARARFDSARANAIAAANQLDDAREALAEITGQPVEAIKGLAADYQPRNDDTQGVDSWVEKALAENPTLQARELALVAAEKNVSTARAGHWPTLSARAGYSDSATWGNSSSGGFAFPATSSQDGSSVSLTLNIPIFSGFATQSRVRQALYQRDAAADQVEQQRRAITRQTRGAYRSLNAGAAEVEARRLAVVSAKAAFEAGEAGLEVGTRTIVDVLIAQQQLFQAQREYARARHTFLVNQLRLKQAAGILDRSDVEAVNRVLIASAEAALDATL